MNVLRLGMEVRYRKRDRKTLELVECSGVIRALDAPSLVWCGPPDVPLWRCDPTPYSWIDPSSE